MCLTNLDTKQTMIALGAYNENEIKLMRGLEQVSPNSFPRTRLWDYLNCCVNTVIDSVLLRML